METVEKDVENSQFSCLASTELHLPLLRRTSHLQSFWSRPAPSQDLSQRLGLPGSLDGWSKPLEI